MSDEYEECDRCGRDTLPDDIKTIKLNDRHEVCYGCSEALTEDIESYRWQDRYTEEHHERALSLFSEDDNIHCTIEDYERGQILIHTDYVSSRVITDFCKHFGYRIFSFGPIWEETSKWKCVEQHGSTFEIGLQYDHHCPMPAATNIKFIENHSEKLSGKDKQF